MTGKAQAELKQSRPFPSLAAEATINIWRVSDGLLRAVQQVLRPSRISETQYNVLRILRGAGPKGLACGEIAGRMISRDPDITRLLGRLEKQGLARSARSPGDRRVVLTQITRRGLELLRKLDRPVLAASERLLGPLGPRRLRQLIALLEDARGESFSRLPHQ